MDARQNEREHPILNIDDVQYRDVGHREKFAARVGDVGGRIGASKLGYNVCAVSPCKRAEATEKEYWEGEG